jgi:hypothetical protein
MQFFTPELYLRYNSPDDTVADGADEAWERVLSDYRTHLTSFAEQMIPRVKELAESLCLHDAELLSLQEDIPGPLNLSPFRSPFSVAAIALGTDGKIINLLYFLWGKVAQSRAPKNWPFSQLRIHWLYDEIDLERRQLYGPLYWHRILLSDGRVVSIPFLDVVIQMISEQTPETASVTKRRA